MQFETLVKLYLYKRVRTSIRKNERNNAKIERNYSEWLGSRSGDGKPLIYSPDALFCITLSILRLSPRTKIIGQLKQVYSASYVCGIDCTVCFFFSFSHAIIKLSSSSSIFLCAFFSILLYPLRGSFFASFALSKLTFSIRFETYNFLQLSHNRNNRENYLWLHFEIWFIAVSLSIILFFRIFIHHFFSRILRGASFLSKLFDDWVLTAPRMPDIGLLVSRLKHYANVVWRRRIFVHSLMYVHRILRRFIKTTFSTTSRFFTPIIFFYTTIIQ